MMYSYSFVNRKRDLSDVLSTVIANEPRFISVFRRVADARSVKHEWLEDQVQGRSLTATAATSAGVLTVSAAEAAKIRVGTLLTFTGQSPLFQVTAVSSGTATISRVAANGSTFDVSGVPETGGVFQIVSTPMQEGTANGDGEEQYALSDVEYNTTQIFRKEIVLSGTALALRTYGSADNQINRQTAFALSALARDLNRVALFGRRVEASASRKGEAGGLYCFGTQTGGLSVNADSAKLDSFLINDAAQLVMAAGGEPLKVLCSPGQARVISNEYKDRLQIMRGDPARGAYVATIVNEVTGRGLEILADPDVPDTDAWLLDPAGFGLANLSGRAIHDEDATGKGFDGIRRIAFGELTFEFKNAKQRCCRIYGLKPSGQAIGDYRNPAARRVEVTNTALPVTVADPVAIDNGEDNPLFVQNIE